jgi:hypothetical protein
MAEELKCAAKELQGLLARLHQSEGVLRKGKLEGCLAQGGLASQEMAQLEFVFARLERIEVILAGRSVQFLGPHKAQIPAVVSGVTGAPKQQGSPSGARKGSARKSSLSASLGGGKLRKSRRAALRKASKARAMGSKIDEKFNEFDDQ